MPPTTWSPKPLTRYWGSLWYEIILGPRTANCFWSRRYAMINLRLVRTQGILIEGLQDSLYWSMPSVRGFNRHSTVQDLVQQTIPLASFQNGLQLEDRTHVIQNTIELAAEETPHHRREHPILLHARPLHKPILHPKDIESKRKEQVQGTFQAIKPCPWWRGAATKMHQCFITLW